MGETVYAGRSRANRHFHTDPGCIHAQRIKKPREWDREEAEAFMEPCDECVED